MTEWLPTVGAFVVLVVVLLVGFRENQRGVARRRGRGSAEIPRGDTGVRIQEVATRDEGQCQVCGHAIAPDRRFDCPHCRTPHHRECWEYNGGCSTFGCAGRRRK